MTATLSVDFETRGRVNLKITGAYAYARHPSTQLLCMSYSFDGGKTVDTWLPGDPFPQAVNAWVKEGKPITAHNAQFERLIWWYVLCNDYDVPEPTLDQFYCSAATARSCGLPGSLGDVTHALGTKQKKWGRGLELIKLLSLPSGAKMTDKCRIWEDGEFNNDPALLGEMVEYCEQDVRSECAVSSVMRELDFLEWTEFWASERVNDRGVKIDRVLAEAATKYAFAEMQELNDACRAVSGYRTASRKLTEWVYVRLSEDARELMHRWKDGERKITLDRSTRASLLEMAERDPDSIREDILEVLRLKDAASNSSVSKFRAMLNYADIDDDRVRGAFLFAGAASTGRYSAKGLQLHNFVRTAAKDPAGVREALLEGREIDNVMATLAGMLRYSIIADEGNVLVGADWSAIEARALPWLAASDGAEEILDVFRAGGDVYVREAGNIYPGQEIGKDERQVGKVAILSLGYGGADGAFAAMARNYGVNLDPVLVKQIVKRWRASNKWAVRFWYELFNAAVRAMRIQDTWHSAGRVKYGFNDAMGGTLWCQLPSGRVLAYPKARLEIENERVSISAVKANFRPKAEDPDWPRSRLWPGLLAENVTQAACADLLRELVVRLDARGVPVIGHVHDEAICEVPAHEEERYKAMLMEEMERGPSWADGLPLKAEVWSGVRYGK